MLVLEDLHWADPTSLRLTEKLAEVVGHAPLLLVATRGKSRTPGSRPLNTASRQVTGAGSGECAFSHSRLVTNESWPDWSSVEPPTRTW